MPTEDDLRAALTSLERHAPAAARVLPGSGRPRRKPRSPRVTRWLAGITTAAALAGLVTALTLPSGTPGTIPNGAVTSPGSTNATVLRAKLLAALSAASDEIVYMRGTYQTAGPHTDPSPTTEQVWYYPGQARVGQLAQARTASVEAGFGHTDVGISYRQPAPKAGLLPGAAQAKGERISVDYTTRTWSDVKDTPVMFQPPYNPALIASYLKSKQWSARDTTLNGRPAIELTLKEVDLKGKTTVNSWTEYLWVDASTYLPLYDVTTFGPPGMATHAVEDFLYLPATPANLAQLTPPIPAGFKRVTPPPVVAPKGPAPSVVLITPKATPSRTPSSRTPSPSASPSSAALASAKLPAGRIYLLGQGKTSPGGRRSRSLVGYGILGSTGPAVTLDHQAYKEVARGPADDRRPWADRDRVRDHGAAGVVAEAAGVQRPAGPGAAGVREAAPGA